MMKPDPRSYHVGSQHPGAKLNEEKVRQIRQELAQTPRPTLTALAKKYGVSPACMQGIAAGTRWRHVK